MDWTPDDDADNAFSMFLRNLSVLYLGMALSRNDLHMVNVIPCINNNDTNIGIEPVIIPNTIMGTEYSRFKQETKTKQKKNVWIN